MKKKLTITLLAALALGACSEQDMNDNQRQGGQQITFVPTVATDWNGATTRAAMQQNAAAKVQQLTDGLYLHTVTTPGFESDQQTGKVTRGTLVDDIAGLGGHFGVSAYLYASNQTSASVAANFFNNVDVKLETGEGWQTSENYYYPGSGQLLSFYAYAPYDHNNTHSGYGITTDGTKNGPMQIGFTVNSDVSQQVDLMVACAENQTFSHSTAVELPFGHALTAINIELDDNMVDATITGITFENVYTSATLTIGGAWIYEGGTTSNMSLDLGDGYKTTDTNGFLKTEKSLTGSSPLLMIPQSFTSDEQRLKVTLSTQETPLYASLKNTAWVAGTTVTYKISTSSVNKLILNQVTYPTTWSTSGMTDLKGSYSNTTNDALGVYGVDATGQVKLVNAKLEKTATGWSDNILYTPGYTYYFYFPYDENGLADTPEMDADVLVGEVGNKTLPTATQFFAGAITTWTPAANQSTAALLNAQDLQIGKGEFISASKVNVAMAHTMGLVSLTLATVNIPETRYSYINDYGAQTSSVLDVNPMDVTASSDFALRTNMFAQNSRLFYYVVNPDDIPEVSCSDMGAGKWSVNSISLSAGSNAYASYTANCARSYIYRGWIFSYRGYGQEFTIPASGNYLIECWGSSGGSPYKTQETATWTAGAGGRGGYISGVINLTKNGKLQMCVGNSPSNYKDGGYNGGGNNTTDDLRCGVGGGCSSVALSSTNRGELKNYASYISEVLIVAGGGGGGGINVDGGAGGMNDGLRDNNYDLQGANATTSAGGAAGINYSHDSKATAGTFGQGGDGGLYAVGAGGGGYYGGGGGQHTTPISSGGGGGGSSFANSSFSSVVMLNGTQSMTHPTTGVAETGHTGAGYIRIATRFTE